MLLEFSVKNYKTFADKVTFVMTPASKKKGLASSVITKCVSKSETIKALCSSVIYGANGAGKSNIISAMETLSNIVVKGGISKSRDNKFSTPNAASTHLELIPNISLDEPRPIDFSITFFEDGLVFKYLLSIFVGAFATRKNERRITFEQLTINDKNIFTRTEAEVDISNSNSVLVEQSNVSLNPLELFLSNGYKSIIDAKTAQIAIDCITLKFDVIVWSNYLRTKLNTFDSLAANPNIKDSIIRLDYMSEAARLVTLNKANIGLRVGGDNQNDNYLVSVVPIGKDSSTAIDASQFESFGTLRFLTFVPVILDALANGTTLVIDELDSSLHPMVLMSIIRVFHDNNVNVKGAQLIFTTHNPIFLRPNLFRRDEIKFVERSADTGNSDIYALSDFSASDTRARLGTDYMKHYFVGKYGALPEIELGSFFEKYTKESDGE